MILPYFVTPSEIPHLVIPSEEDRSLANDPRSRGTCFYERVGDINQRP